MRRQITTLFVAIVACSALALQMSAQQLTAEIKGTVSDASGAAIPEATVTATNTQTQVKNTIPTKGDGSYDFLHLQVGNYDECC